MGEIVSYDFHGFKFTWTSDKAARNHEKHGVSFEVACQAVVNDVQVVEEQCEAGEQRFAVIAFPLSEYMTVPLFVVVTDDEGAWRIVTARRTTPAERRRYEEEIGSY